MGKAAMCIRLLQILNTGGIFKISELAEILETNPRNIIEYKKELDEISFESGYYIDTVPGRYGGYRLNGNATIPSVKLTVNEKNALMDSYKHILADTTLVNKADAISAYSKIMSNMIIEEKDLEFLSVNKVNTNYDLNVIKKWYDIINECIKKKKAILMTYNYLKEPQHQVKVHPYMLFRYDNEWRFFAWNCETNDIFYFKLSRIEDISITNETFRVWKYFKPENYLKNGVFTPNGEMFPLTLIASGIRAKLFKEKEFGKNQVCEDLPDGRVKITLEMQKNHSTYNFILGCGDLLEVVEPEWLKEKVIDLAKSILDIYKE